MYDINKNYMIFKNEIVECFNEVDKMVIYEALRNDINVMYTTNERTIPCYDNLYVSIDGRYKIIINPKVFQLDWMDTNILNINVLDSKLNNKNVCRLIDARINKVDMYSKMINNLCLNVKYQYSYEVVKEYVEYKMELLELV